MERIPGLLTEGNEYKYDLRWLVEKLLSFESDLKLAIDLQTIVYADPIQWDITSQYTRNTVVLDGYKAYLSKQPVPRGIALTNTDYWQAIFDLTPALRDLIPTEIMPWFTAKNWGNATIAPEAIDNFGWFWLNNQLCRAKVSPLIKGTTLTEGVSYEAFPDIENALNSTVYITPDGVTHFSGNVWDIPAMTGGVPFVRQFPTFDAMKASDAKIGDVSYILGYNQAYDGGAGFWKLLEEGTENGLDIVSRGDGTFFHRVGGEKTIYPIQFGIQPGQNLDELLKKYNHNIEIDLQGGQYVLHSKIELLSNFTLRNGTVQCVIDKDCHDTYFSTEEGAGIKNTTFIDCNIIGVATDTAKITDRPYLLYLKGENNVIRNCHVEVQNVPNYPVGGSALWIRHGKTIMENSDFIAASAGNEGGAFWARAYETFDSLDFVAINCTFLNNTQDEAIAVWGSGTMSGQFINCHFGTERSKYAYTFRTFNKPIDVYFSNCDFAGSSDSSVFNSQDAETSGGNVTLTFDSCKFNYKVAKSAAPFFDMRGVNAAGKAKVAVNDCNIVYNNHLITSSPGVTLKNSVIDVSSAIYDFSGGMFSNVTAYGCTIIGGLCYLGGKVQVFENCNISTKDSAVSGIDSFLSMVGCTINNIIRLHNNGSAKLNIRGCTGTGALGTDGTKFTSGNVMYNTLTLNTNGGNWFSGTPANVAYNNPGVVG